MLALQRAVGNAAFVRMLQLSGHPYALSPVQQKEQDLERHQHGASCGHQQAEQPDVQRSSVHGVLSGSGRPLAAPLREEMEARLGADFSDVRIHDNQAARDSAAEIGARAYTSGNNIALGDGGTDKHTLAHELTHVIQQRRGPVAGTDNGAGLSISDPSDRFEREAESNATRVMAGTAPVQRTEGTEETLGRDVQAHETNIQRAPRTKAVDGPKQGDHLFNALGSAILGLIPSLRTQNRELAGDDPQIAERIDQLEALANAAVTQRANANFESAAAVKGGGSGRTGDANSQRYGEFSRQMVTAVNELPLLYGWADMPAAAAVKAVSTQSGLESIIFDQDAYRRKKEENGVKKKPGPFETWVTNTKDAMWALFQAYLAVVLAINSASAP
ncbi:DUF4157 domain-containing protein [Streptomyces sp. c-19]|uniref:eCIS core domain-containing protein n=1 Tax=Streptomyces sp. c-19 TaxID=2789275 RepID=UPI003980102A